jgi:hypothetical protein
LVCYFAQLVFCNFGGPLFLAVIRTKLSGRHDVTGGIVGAWGLFK